MNLQIFTLKPNSNFFETNFDASKLVISSNKNSAIVKNFSQKEQQEILNCVKQGSASIYKNENQLINFHWNFNAEHFNNFQYNNLRLECTHLFFEKIPEQVFFENFQKES